MKENEYSLSQQLSQLLRNLSINLEFNGQRNEKAEQLKELEDSLVLHKESSARDIDALDRMEKTLRLQLGGKNILPFRLPRKENSHSEEQTDKTFEYENLAQLLQEQELKLNPRMRETVQNIKEHMPILILRKNIPTAFRELQKIHRLTGNTALVSVHSLDSEVFSDLETLSQLYSVSLFIPELTQLSDSRARQLISLYTEARKLRPQIQVPALLAQSVHPLKTLQSTGLESLLEIFAIEDVEEEAAPLHSET